MVKQNSVKDQVFTFQTIPNLLLTVYAGTTFTLEDGSHPDPFPLIAINVPVDRLPDQMPRSALVTPFIVAFQPANAVASQPVAVNYPNPLNIAPGSHATFMTLDPTRGLMVPYGTATVSRDGSRFLADADPANINHRYGLVHFDWHGAAMFIAAIQAIIKELCPDCSPPPAGVNICPICAATNNPIDLASGVEVLRNTDLSISNARGSLSLTRTYRTLNANFGPFGIGTGHNYFYRLDTLTPQTAAVVKLFFPDGNSFPFKRIVGSNQLVNTTTPILAGAIMTANADSTTDIRWKDGTIYHFIPIIGASFLSVIANGPQRKHDYSYLVSGRTAPASCRPSWPALDVDL